MKNKEPKIVSTFSVQGVWAIYEDDDKILAKIKVHAFTVYDNETIHPITYMDIEDGGLEGEWFPRGYIYDDNQFIELNEADIKKFKNRYI